MPRRVSSGSQTLEPGFVVEIWTSNHDRERDGNGFVGEVQAVDNRGVRLTLIDWFVGSFSGWDVFVPWLEIKEAWIATPEHDKGLFLDQILHRASHLGAAASQADKR